MTEFFLVLVNRSIFAAILTAAVLLLRMLFRKAPKWTHCLLWALVAVQLLCPFRPESRASLMPPTVPITQQLLEQQLPDRAFEAPAQQEQPARSDQQALSGRTEPETDPLRLLSLIWLAGMCAMLLYALTAYGRLKQRMAAAVKLRDNIYESDRTASPFVLGILRPRIYLPFGLQEPERSLVLAHEQAHILRRDHWWKPLGFLVLSVYWFNPLLWLAYALLCRDIELACDEKVIASLDHDRRADYSQALLSVSVSRRRISACPLAFGQCDVKTRIKHVLSYRKPAFWSLSLAVLACILAAVCFLTVPPAPRYDFEADPIAEAQAGVSKPRSLNQNQLDELTSRLSHLPVEKLRTSEPKSSATARIALQTRRGIRVLIEGFYHGWVHLQWEDALYRTNDPEFSRYLTHVCQGSDAASAVDAAQPSPFGRTYETTEIAYEAAVYSFGYTAETAPSFTLTAQGGLTVSERQDGQFWKELGIPDGGFAPTTLTGERFEALVPENSCWSGTDARTLLEHNRQVWQAVTPDGGFYLLLQQNTGELYLAFGYTDAQSCPVSIRWIFRLEPAGSTEDAASDDSTAQITALLDTICSSPAQASFSGSYIQAHPSEYDTLVSLGDTALRYCFSEFRKGNQTDLRGHVLAQLCWDIINLRQETYELGDLFPTGQDWFDSFQAEALRLEDAMGLSQLQKSHFAAWLLLTM